MKTINRYVLISVFSTLVLTLFNCSSDDNLVLDEISKQENETQNQAPEAFNLITVADGATEVDVKPTFSWDAAIDPDGDAISYELFVDSNDNPRTSIATNISGTDFTLDERLPLNENLFWKVTATDTKGNSSSSNIFDFTTRNLEIPATPVTANAAFTERTDHTSVIFDDKIWVIGGYDGASHLNDVWQSTDGKTWTQVTAEAPFHKRRGHTSVVFDNKIWVIGGYTGTDYLRDIWYSTDGETWTKVTGASPFPARGLHSAVVFKDKLWVIGSLDESAKLMNTIWQSIDGITWTPVDSVSPFPERTGHTTLVFDDKIWIIGGENFDGLQSAIWSSDDGKLWSKVTEQTIFNGKKNHTTVVFDNKLWVIGGIGTKTRQNDVYQSVDGITWSSISAEIPFIERTGHTTVAFDNKIWIIGGTGGVTNTFYLNDVWSMD